MEKQYIYTSGHCPILDEEHTVLIEYGQPPATQGYKAFSYECDHIDNCRLNVCPIFCDNQFFLQR